MNNMFNENYNGSEWEDNYLWAASIYLTKGVDSLHIAALIEAGDEEESMEKARIIAEKNYPKWEINSIVTTDDIIYDAENAIITKEL